ncbi:Uncharacterised protein [Mycobacteroides abscessus subsp. abscessus]|nr:Uncharacterised protein [Mycobacteroides abscessus subsp. abscessus]
MTSITCRSTGESTHWWGSTASISVVDNSDATPMVESDCVSATGGVRPLSVKTSSNSLPT